MFLMEGKSKRIPFVKLETNKYKMYEEKIKSNKITIRRSPLVINYIRVIFDNLRNLNSLFICVWCCSQMFYEGVLMLVLVQNVRQAAKEMLFFFFLLLCFMLQYVQANIPLHSPMIFGLWILFSICRWFCWCHSSVIIFMLHLISMESRLFYAYLLLMYRVYGPAYIAYIEISKWYQKRTTHYIYRFISLMVFICLCFPWLYFSL